MGEDPKDKRRDRERAPQAPYRDGEPGEDPAYAEALGRAVQALRAERGLSRADLAERAGLSYSYLSEIETGKKSGTSSKVLYLLAKALGVTVRELMTIAEERVLPAMREQDVSTAMLSEFSSALPSEAPEETRRVLRSWFRDDARVEASRVAASRPDDRRAAIAHDLAALLPELSAEDLALVLDLARRLRRR